MHSLRVSHGALLCFLMSLLYAASFCHGKDNLVEVVGIGDCADCAQSNIKSSQAYSGLRVTIDCKPENGELKTRGVGELDEEGKFKVSLPHDIVKDGKLKEECYAQLHSASGGPCPAYNGLESNNIVLKTKTNDKHTFGLAGKLKFSPVTCTSAFLSPHYKHPWVPLPKYSHPELQLPTLKNFGHPFPKFPPKVFPPFPPKVFPPFPPKVFPPLPTKVFPPLPPKVFPPLPPKVFPPLPPKVFPPIYKKPFPLIPKIPPFHEKPFPPIPKIPPFHEKPFPPIPKIPLFHEKPFPTIPKIPPFHEKPFPPIPKIPPFHEKPLPPFPKIPPK